MVRSDLNVDPEFRDRDYLKEFSTLEECVALVAYLSVLSKFGCVQRFASEQSRGPTRENQWRKNCTNKFAESHCLASKMLCTTSWRTCSGDELVELVVLDCVDASRNVPLAPVESKGFSWVVYVSTYFFFLRAAQGLRNGGGRVVGMALGAMSSVGSW